MRFQTLLNPFAFFKQFYYYKYLIPSEKYKYLIDTNPKKAQEIMWFRCYRQKFPWNNPVTLNEKIIWLSAMTDTSKWTECSDKYEVRKYVESLGLGHILTKCYGVWNHFDDIDFSKLPDQFVLKCTHDCGSTVIVKDKSQMNISQMRTFLEGHLSKRFGYQFCEPHYTKIKPRIMAEEFINNSVLDKSFSSYSLVDYKYWCFEGKSEWAFVCYDRHLDSEGDSSSVFDLYSIKDWKAQRQYITDSYKNVTFKDVPKPENLNEMVHIVELLSKEFHQVRVDLYNVNGKIYFGEMTFTSQGGRMTYFTDAFQKLLGNNIIVK